jgi:hypothetical protein
MKEYYGWPAYWQDRSNPDFPVGSLPAGREFPVHSHEDPHLRSAEDVAGYEVRATDGELGHVQSFIVDEGSWHIGYLDVKTGDWLHRRSMLVPTRLVTSVSWAHHRINVAHAWKLG